MRVQSLFRMMMALLPVMASAKAAGNEVDLKSYNRQYHEYGLMGGFHSPVFNGKNKRKKHTSGVSIKRRMKKRKANRI